MLRSARIPSPAILVAALVLMLGLAPAPARAAVYVLDLALEVSRTTGVDGISRGDRFTLSLPFDPEPRTLHRGRAMTLYTPLVGGPALFDGALSGMADFTGSPAKSWAQVSENSFWMGANRSAGSGLFIGGGELTGLTLSLSGRDLLPSHDAPPWMFDPSAIRQAEAVFTITHPSERGDGRPSWAGQGGGTYGRIETDISTVMVSPIPELDTWLMMITGFGLVAMRVKRLRRRRALAAA